MIADLQKRLYETAKNNGWHDFNDDERTLFINLLGEIAEAWEEHRKGDSVEEVAFWVEIADLVIRILDAAEQHGVNMEPLIDDTRIMANPNQDHVDIIETLYIEVSRHFFSFTRTDVVDWDDLALVVKYCLLAAEANGFDLFDIINVKNEHNKTRGYRHGGKIC